MFSWLLVLLQTYPFHHTMEELHCFYMTVWASFLIFIVSMFFYEAHTLSVDHYPEDFLCVLLQQYYRQRKGPLSRIIESDVLFILVAREVG